MTNIYFRSIKNALQTRSYRIGFVISGFPVQYTKATASLRLRVYDVIEMFAHDPDVLVELYVPWRQYDLVIFEKTITKDAIDLAHKLKRNNTKLLLDINVDYFSTKTPSINKDLVDTAHELANTVDGIVTASKYLADTLKDKKVHTSIYWLPEAIAEKYFHVLKKVFTEPPQLIWSGYYQKASELLEIKDILSITHEIFKSSLVIISNKDPNLPLKYKYIRYDERTIATDLSQGDVFIAPRRLNKEYKYHHTFTKIGAPMAVGLPVIASPVPAYMASPAVLCENKKEWQETLTKLHEGKINLPSLSKGGRDYCKQYYSWKHVQKLYKDLFSSLIAENR